MQRHHAAESAQGHLPWRNALNLPTAHGLALAKRQRLPAGDGENRKTPVGCSNDPGSRRLSRPSSVADLLSATAGGRRVGLKSGRASTAATCSSSSAPLSRGAATGLRGCAENPVAAGSRRVPASNSANSTPAKTAHPASGREASRRAIMRRAGQSSRFSPSAPCGRHNTTGDNSQNDDMSIVCRANPCPQSRVGHDGDKRDENADCWTRPHPENVARRQSAGYIEHLESGRLDLYR
jgi:hypothetical protein